MIRFDEVSYSYGRKTPGRDRRQRVLKDVSMAVASGEIVCLLGPSGCGKTTMVNLLMGLMVPLTGQVSVLGKRAPYAGVRNRLGYMPQDDALYLDITGEENLAFFATMNGVPRARAKVRIDELLDFTLLTEHRRKLVSAYSGGMRRRLSLAIALLHEPDVLVLDEPTVGLDPDHRRRIWDHFRDLAAGGTTLLVTTHVMDEALRCDRIAMLYSGRIIADGSPTSIMADTGTDNLDDAFLALAQTESDKELNHA